MVQIVLEKSSICNVGTDIESFLWQEGVIRRTKESCHDADVVRSVLLETETHQSVS